MSSRVLDSPTGQASTAARVAGPAPDETLIWNNLSSADA
jgi:hypothetical protein